MSQSTDPTPELPEGTALLERYTIIDRIAAGGMASIFRANDERLDRVVCVKLLKLLFHDSSKEGGGAVYQATYAHFLKEALALSKLQHPNTLRIYDFGYLPEGRPFQISEFLDAGNLEQHIRTRGKLTPSEALGILERISGAIAEAHTHEIIHRDIKPSNILFARVGDTLVPKLADFGIARSDLRKKPKPGEEEDTEYVSTVPLFSPRWAAPEQIVRGEDGPWTDVYALGLLTAFMLSGRILFDTRDVRATFRDRALGDAYVEQRLTDVGFSGQLRAVLLHALHARPDARPQGPTRFFEELHHALGKRATTLPSPVPARETLDSITVDTRGEDFERADAPATPERWVEANGRRVRLIEVHEKLDMTLTTDRGVDIRFRTSVLPARQPAYRLHVKGLNCFVSSPGGRPSPAIVADTDGSAEFISMSQEILGSVSWSFGHEQSDTRVFRVAGGDLVIPFPLGRHALVIDLGPSRELVAICRRS